MEGASDQKEGDAASQKLTVQERILGNGMLYRTNATTAYTISRDGSRVNPNAINANEFSALVQTFRANPAFHLAHARENLRAIMHDKKLKPEERVDRVKRYVDAYLELQVKLDRAAFPPDERVHAGVPSYIPDGLSDMGSDQTVDPRQRSREKIRVDKAKIFEKAKPLFYEIFSAQFDNKVSSEQWKEYVAKRIGHYVYTSMPYNYQQRAHPRQGDRSIRLDEVEEERLAVCRHHALVTQVLNQSFGITSLLMKSDVTFGAMPAGPHANNLVRIEGKWHLMDSTAPEIKRDGKGEIFLKRISEKDIDLNARPYRWRFQEEGGRAREYTSRSNMYFRVRDNIKDPAIN